MDRHLVATPHSERLWYEHEIAGQIATLLETEQDDNQVRLLLTGRFDPVLLTVTVIATPIHTCDTPEGT